MEVRPVSCLQRRRGNLALAAGGSGFPGGRGNLASGTDAQSGCFELNGGLRKALLLEVTGRRGFACVILTHTTVTEFDEVLWGSMVDFIMVGAKKEMTVTFKDGTEIQT